ncbi:RNA-guided endonuclease TnpB family protein [Candidatus Pacearchaeota archaeon]|jgi:IS605 OrfB family transposase|nr:RNA-guided endonuclease TnpB family protein [Candidatus Pacearchaeota archaeon]
MIRKSTISINKANTGKLQILGSLLEESAKVINKYISIFYDNNVFEGNYVYKSIYDLVGDTWLSPALKQSLAQQALQIVKSQRKKKKKIKPVFKKKNIILNSNFVTINFNISTSFDIWIKFWNIGNHFVFKIPSKKHEHFNSFESWNLKKSIRLRKRSDGAFFVDLFFQKDVTLKETGKAIGLDCGYKKLAVLSTKQQIGTELEKKIENISRKVQGSKAFKRKLIERDNYINRVTKEIPFETIKILVVEDLKNVKKHSKGKFTKKFNNKLQRWSYSYFLNRLRQRCEISGVHVHKVNPAYTSQECSMCKAVHKENRNGEIFKCKSCGYTTDADYNASLNILNRFLLQEPTDPVQENYNTL